MNSQTTSTDVIDAGRGRPNNRDCDGVIAEDVALARRMRYDLRDHTRDRKWRFKSYPNCFRADHALNWALRCLDANEGVAISRLNDLIDRGYLRHVVDPRRRMRVGETRTLYYRIVSDDVLDGAMTTSLMTARGRDDGGGGAVSPATCRDGGEATSSFRPPVAGTTATIGDADIVDDAAMVGVEIAEMRERAMDIDGRLQRTIDRLNRARGKLEVIHQEMLILISQQIYTFVVIFVMYVNNVLTCASIPTTMNDTTIPSSWGMMMGWFVSTSLAVAMIAYARCSWRFIALRSYLDESVMPMDTIVNEDDEEEEEENGSQGTEIYNTSGEDSEDMNPTRRRPHSLTAAISKSLQLATAAGLRSFRRLPSRQDRSIVLMRDERSLPNVEEWKHRPLLICANTTAVPDMTIVEYNDGHLPLGVPFKFSSAMFEGTCLIRVKGSKSDAPEDDATYFSGRKRIFQSVVQGRFREEVKVSDVMTGHEFARPLRNLPHPILLKTATNLLSKISPGMSINVHADQPHIKSSLMETTQIFRGDQPGNEPDIACHRIREDSSIFGGVFANGNIASSRRKRIFSNPANCHEYTFDTETVYTFEFYQNAFDGQSYSLDLGFTKIGCSKIFDGQPIQWLGKMKDGRYLWSFQIWHESLLSKDTGKRYDWPR
ncbi:hypothetical protein ACHAXA_006640 [Cyclostephanos tholiformis]|uniref:Uncharacterized protein n=1 Tax=Cyclostephanos tholiformis TaxID=382380 RepID=A0ABD3RHH1_9STRA